MSEGGTRGARPAYNPLYERFVTDDQSGGDQLTGMVAYGLYKQAKREWTTEHFDRHGQKPTEEQLSAYIATWTPSMVQNLREQANGIVLEYGGFLVEENTPRIREEALRGTFWKSVGISIFAAALYTLGLVALLIILRFAGVDFLSILTSVNSAAPAG